MKNNKIFILHILAFIINVGGFAQIQITNTKDYKVAPRLNSPSGTYIKDIDGDFDYLVGTWVWINLDKKVTFKIKKISQSYLTSNQTYQDVLVADYIYTTDFEQNTIVNTIINNQNDLNPAHYPMFSLGPYIANPGIISFAFEDKIIQKNGRGVCSALFTKVPNTNNQMSVELLNPKEGAGLMFPGDLPFNPEFGLPTNMIVTKQP